VCGFAAALLGGSSHFSSMASLGWALGPFLSEPVVTTFRVMLSFHAAINAIGLVLCGLIALRRLATQHHNSQDHQPTPIQKDHHVLADPADR
jgi:hypothetical protein